ncbi:MAG: SHOCT domain-containing protein [Oscillospiraceae bacterium]
MTSTRCAAKERESKKRPSGVQIRDFHKNLAAQERENSEKRWEIARRKQADSGEVHSVHMDSCEDRLESLKVLYDAGILDREEYAQRVARVKKAHAQSRG